MASIVDSVRGKPGLFIAPLAALVVWTLLEAVSLVAGGIPAFSGYWVAATLMRLAAIGLNLWFAKVFFLDGRHGLYAAFRKYVGYAVVFVYGSANLPILDWQAAGLLDAGGAFAHWALAALQAVAAMVVWMLLRIKPAQVFWGHISAEEARDKKLLRQRLKAEKRGPLFAVFDNLDMFVQTIFLVILLQQFVFQLYVIPSGSMIPTMLVGERPFVVKTFDGPAVPLSGVKLPTIAGVERGQIVVFESPAYVEPPLYIKVVQQFVFYLTLSLVDLDKDENGQPKVHFVVKRVVGVPGDKLMMVDDVLYRKGRGDADFTPLAADEAWRHVDLWKLESRLKERVAADDIKMDEATRSLLDRWDARRKNLDLSALDADLARRPARLAAALAAPRAAAAIDAAFFADDSGTAARLVDSARAIVEPRGFTVWQDPRNLSAEYSAALVRAMAADSGLRNSFAVWLGSARLDAAALAGLNAYDRGAHALNLIYKDILSRQMLAIAEKAAAGDGATLRTDPALAVCQTEAGELGTYLSHYDNRNFPEFPAGADEYIPDGKFFLVGDNRYNSLDFRFDIEMRGRTKPVDAGDPQSVLYYTALAPRLLDRERIVGHVAFRLFPFDRIGPVTP